ncbi:MAG: 50S ribosomal protein L10 [Helicobacteraceae bacterium]|jgi:large subunit ribosomal protein L10|nr:50S ribosomal protein L10 [Helicobacteraceae bacterium]
MTKAKKAEIISFLTEEFKNSDTILVADYKGLAVAEFEDLRNQVRKIGGFTQASKNTLASIALKNAGKEGLTLKDGNVFIWGADGLGLIKTVGKFAESAKDKFVVKQGHIDNKAVEASYIEALAKLPSRERLIGMLLSVWIAPLRGFVTGLDNLSKKLAA